MGRPTSSDQAATAEATEIDRVADAQYANAQEHELTFWQALRLYPKGVFWSVAMSTAIIMEGYDTKLLGTLFAQPTFQRTYGELMKGNSYQITAAWQTGLSNGSSCGVLLGLLMAGTLSERFGFRLTMIAGLALTIGLIFILFFATNLTVLLVGEILLGVPIGLFQTIPVVYALEVSPLSLRAYLTNYVNSCWAIGQIIATGVLRGVLNIDNEWAYRIPFAIQWIWPLILIPLLFFAPESPWWLVRRGRLEEAKEVMRRLTSPKNVNFDIDKSVALMVVTTEHERTINSETSYMACFHSTNLRRTITVIGIYCIQTLNGNPLRGYSTYFFQQAGLPVTESFNLSIVGFALALVGGAASWLLLPLFGRRTIYLWGLNIMFIIMLLTGALGVPQAQSPQASLAWGIGALLLISSFLYNATIGPLTNTLVSEIPSTIVRSKSVVLVRWCYAVTTIIAGVLTPYQLNPTAWNWSAKTGFFWAGGCLISIVFSYFMVPEPKNRTTAEIDILYERKVPARHFAKTHVDLTEAIYGEEKGV